MAKKPKVETPAVEEKETATETKATKGVVRVQFEGGIREYDSREVAEGFVSKNPSKRKIL